MKLIGASIVFVCDDEFRILKNYGVVISDGKIIDIDKFKILKEKYKNIESIFFNNSILLPALINSHIHFEFSKENNFVFGSFDKWLLSVMKQRESVLSNVHEHIINAIETQKKSGVGTVLAISSHDLDLELLYNSSLKVIFSPEVIGANKNDFEIQKKTIDNRLKKVLSLQNERFIPSISIHAPYSVHKDLAEYVIKLAIKHDLLLSVHFLESLEESKWLCKQKSFFHYFYENILKLKATPFYSPESFLNLFKDSKSVFVHCLYLNENLESKISNIISCPRSNVLLNQKMGKNNIIATDGISSNFDVNLLNELRFTFLNKIMFDDDLERVAIDLIKSVTLYPAKALGLNNGSLRIGFDADICVFSFEHLDIANPVSFFIFHSKIVRSLFVNGIEV